ncbi:MAG: RtcB family protein [Planctomycetota bacterium]|nr:RtcB family protein [Planctomycetota bacterium]
MKQQSTVPVERIDENRWLIPRHGGMKTEGLVFASEAMMKTLRGDPSLVQVANVAHLPGILGRSMAMPDIHWGYGFPIGGVAAFDENDGVISPGGVGYDINCGVRLLRSNLGWKDVEGKMDPLVESLFRNIPTGVGSHRKDFRVPPGEYDDLLRDGARWAVSKGFGREEDPSRIEEGGRLPGADPGEASDRAKQRGKNQLGTLGSGNHFVEVQVVDEIFDSAVAKGIGLEQDSIAVMIHTGSRGFGYQVCDDSIKRMLKASRKYGIELPDRQLCCAPLTSPEGKQYLAAMATAANYAFANRQIITHWVRESFEKVLGRRSSDIGLDLVYDVCHNIAKFEDHRVNGKMQRVCVHRKGATRAFPPGHADLPEIYRETGQPVLVPGDMGRYSFVLVGTDGAYGETFGSSCHGAGRAMSRTKAGKIARDRPIVREMREQGIIVRASGMKTLREEIPEAYKDVADVVGVVDRAGIGKKVARLRPVGVIKG